MEEAGLVESGCGEAGRASTTVAGATRVWVARAEEDPAPEGEDAGVAPDWFSGTAATVVGWVGGVPDSADAGSVEEAWVGEAWLLSGRAVGEVDGDDEPPPQEASKAKAVKEVSSRSECSCIFGMASAGAAGCSWYGSRLANGCKQG